MILILKHKWFDMIAAGEKKEEYRRVIPRYIRIGVGTNRKAPEDRIIELRRGYSKTFLKVRASAQFCATNRDIDRAKSMGVRFRADWGYDGSKRVIVFRLGEIVEKRGGDE